MAKEYDCEHCEHWAKDSFGDRVCEFDGDCENPAPQTNEEYLRSLNTEQFAEFLKCITVDAMDDQKKGDKHWTYTPSWVEWLKQPKVES